MVPIRSNLHIRKIIKAIHIPDFQPYNLRDEIRHGYGSSLRLIDGKPGQFVFNEKDGLLIISVGNAEYMERYSHQWFFDSIRVFRKTTGEYFQDLDLDLDHPVSLDSIDGDFIYASLHTRKTFREFASHMDSMDGFYEFLKAWKK